MDATVDCGAESTSGCGKTVYVVCQLREERDGEENRAYDLIGVFPDESSAVACANNPVCFVAEVPFGVELPGNCFADGWYPLTQGRPARRVA